MTDYLRPVGRAGRIISVVGCTLVFLLCLLLSLLLRTDMVRRRSLEYEGKPLWIGAVMVAATGLAAAVTGVTVLPA